MKMIYVAGPYTPRNHSNHMGVFINIARGTKTCAKLATTGRYSPINPWTDWLMTMFEESIPMEIYYAMALEQMRRCDAVLLTDGWNKSSGTIAEVKEAIIMNIPVFISFIDVNKAIAAMDQYFEWKDQHKQYVNTIELPDHIKATIINAHNVLEMCQ